MKDGGTYVPSDLAGTWTAHSLMCGTVEGWSRGTLTLDSAGSGTIVWENSDGISGTEDVTFTLAPDGKISEPGNEAFLGKMSQDKKMIVSTDDWAPDLHALTVLVKSGGTFAPSSIEGTWHVHSLSSGGAEDDWVKGIMALNSEGNGTISYQDSDAYSGTDDVSFLVQPDGKVLQGSDPNFDGTMRFDSNLLIGTNTWGNGVHAFSIAAKVSQ